MSARWTLVPVEALRGVGAGSCTDCKHGNVSLSEEPCASCGDDCDKWEAGSPASEDSELLAAIAGLIDKRTDQESYLWCAATARAVLRYLESGR